MEMPGREILKYYLYRATMAVGFTTPIWYLYVLNNGVSYAQMGVIDAVWWLGLLVFEIPTGYIGDRIGRRRGLIVGSVVTMVAMVGMGLSSGFFAFAALYTLWAFGITFRSGTADAWLYDVLKAQDHGDEFAHIRGRGNSVALVVTGVTALLGGYIAEIGSMEYTWYASAAVTSLSIPILLTLPKEGAEGVEKTSEDQFTIFDAIPLLKENFTKAPLRGFVIYVGLINAVYWGVNFFVQPISTDIGLSVSQLGWMFAGFTALGAVASYYTDRIQTAIGIRGWFHMLPLVLGGLFVITAFVPALAIPAFFVMRAEKNITKAFAGQFINDRIESFGRATVLSAAGMVYTFLIIPFELGAGVLGEIIGPIQTVGLYGGLLIAGTLLVWLVDDPFED